MTEVTKQPTVFLCFAPSDAEAAGTIVEALAIQNIKVLSINLAQVEGKTISAYLQEIISASDYLIILLSPDFVGSAWLQYELGVLTKIQDLGKRDITLIPVLIKDTEIPLSIQKYQFFDCRSNFQYDVKELAKKISAIPEIDFSRLDWGAFESLVADLLIELNFKNVEKQARYNEFRIDIKADYLRCDPFGASIKETWLAECKFYRESRVDLGTIQQLLYYLLEIGLEGHGLLITNSQLTSVAKDYLDQLKVKFQKDIRVIDGTELKRLLLQHNNLIKKYFSANREIKS